MFIYREKKDFSFLESLTTVFLVKKLVIRHFNEAPDSWCQELLAEKSSKVCDTLLGILCCFRNRLFIVTFLLSAVLVCSVHVVFLILFN